MSVIDQHFEEIKIEAVVDVDKQVGVVPVVVVAVAVAAVVEKIEQSIELFFISQLDYISTFFQRESTLPGGL